jgi:hypothetical protein
MKLRGWILMALWSGFYRSILRFVPHWNCGTEKGRSE